MCKALWKFASVYGRPPNSCNAGPKNLPWCQFHVDHQCCTLLLEWSGIYVRSWGPQDRAFPKFRPTSLLLSKGNEPLFQECPSLVAYLPWSILLGWLLWPCNGYLSCWHALKTFFMNLIHTCPFNPNSLPSSWLMKPMNLQQNHALPFSFTSRCQVYSSCCNLPLSWG
jgi:hypothetical protein